MPISLSEAIGDATQDGDLQAMAAAVLAHPGSRELPRSALLACAKVALSRHLPSEPENIELVRSLARTVLATELGA